MEIEVVKSGHIIIITHFYFTLLICSSFHLCNVFIFCRIHMTYLIYKQYSAKLQSLTMLVQALRAGSDGRMSASGSAGPGFDPRRGSRAYFLI